MFGVAAQPFGQGLGTSSLGARDSITVFEDDTFSTISVNIRFSKISRFGDYAPTIADCQSRGGFKTAVLNSVR